MQKIQISSEYAYHMLILMNLCLHLISLQKFAKKNWLKIHKSLTMKSKIFLSFSIIFKKMLSICLFFTECKARYAYKEKACIYRYGKSKIGIKLCFI